MGVGFGGTGGAGGGAGGGGLVLRDPPDQFTGANAAAARTARDTFFALAANAAVLRQYQGNESLVILLAITGSDPIWETYLPGDTPGDTYDSTMWVTRTDAVQGPTGAAGAGVVQGTAARPQLRWDAVNSRWNAVSTIRTSYLAMTRGGTAQHLASLFMAVAGMPGDIGEYTGNYLYHPSNTVFSLYTAASGRRDDEPKLEDLWYVGNESPWFWLITPTYYKLIPNFQYNFRSRIAGTDVQEDIQAVALPWHLVIDGVQYDVAQAQTTLSRPADTDNGSIGIFYQYTQPSDPHRTVTIMP